MTKLIAAPVAVLLSLAACSGGSESNSAAVDAGNEAGLGNDVSAVDGDTFDNAGLDLDNGANGTSADLNSLDATGNGGEVAGNTL